MIFAFRVGVTGLIGDYLVTHSSQDPGTVAPLLGLLFTGPLGLSAGAVLVVAVIFGGCVLAVGVACLVMSIPDFNPMARIVDVNLPRLVIDLCSEFSR